MSSPDTVLFVASFLPPSVSEPAALVLLGSSLLAAGFGARWLQRRRRLARLKAAQQSHQEPPLRGANAPANISPEHAGAVVHAADRRDPFEPARLPRHYPDSPYAAGPSHADAPYAAADASYAPSAFSASTPSE